MAAVAGSTVSEGDRGQAASPAGAPGGKVDDHTPNLGVHIANRLVEVGCTTAFAVPGDFNLLLLDQLLKQPQLELVSSDE